MAQSVYIVTSGEYSDYRIEAVFDNEQAAKDFTESIPYTTIEPYPINSVNPHSGYKAFKVVMQKDGTVDEVKNEQPDDKVTISNAHAFVANRSWNNRPNVLIVQCFARDEAHAIKIAGEKRSQAIAANEL